MVSNEKLMLTTKEAAELMNCGVQNVYQMIHAKNSGFPCVRLGARTIRIPRLSLECWIENAGEKRLFVDEDF